MAFSLTKIDLSYENELKKLSRKELLRREQYNFQIYSKNLLQTDLNYLHIRILLTIRTHCTKFLTTKK